MASSAGNSRWLGGARPRHRLLTTLGAITIVFAVAFVMVSPALASTSGGGGLTADTTWVVAGSPWLVMGEVPPTVRTFAPSFGLVGALVTIYGTGLKTGALSVKFNGTAATGYNVPSATQIVATVPAGATTGPISITTGGGTATSAHDFSVIQAPTISGLTPTSGPVSTEVRVSGTGFTDLSSVEFNGHSASVLANPAGTEIVTAVPPGATTGPISVTSAGGTATSSSSFTVNQGPRVTLLQPAFGSVGSGIGIVGMNFTGATAVKFNGASASYNVNGETQISATVPEGATTGPISVTTPLGTSVTAGNFTVTKPSAPPPTISGFTPSYGPVGTTVTITGTNFIGVGAVRFKHVESTDFNASSSTTIHAVVPTDAVILDSSKITITAEGGAATSVDEFTVRPNFSVTGCSPRSGPVGTRVTITGTGFNLVTAVKFNGRGASFTPAFYELVATVPPNATSGPIEVEAATGWASPGSFTVVVPKPKIVSLSPLSGRRGTIVTVSGTGFRSSRGTGNVKFGTTKCGTYVSWSNTRIRCKVPSKAAFGRLSIKVTTAGGTSNIKTFTVKR